MLCSQGSSGLSSPQATFGRKVKRLLSCIIKSEWGRLKHLSAAEAGGRSCAETKRRSWNSQSHGGPSRLAWMSSLRAGSPGQSPTLPLSHLPNPILPALLPASPNSTHVLVSALLPTTQTQAA